MTTSLAQQLQKLALPQTNLLQRDKKRASLLFDPKDAADIDRDTFYDIGISGLKELNKLNGDFAIFENSLFSISAQQIERAIESKDANVKIDRNIKKFLSLLSPYFLLKPAHKALEWLIYRFSIHDYNKDDVMKLILPYHETNIFIKFLQILNIRNENDRWHWLRDLQKAGVHVPKLTLFNHAASNSGFMQFVADMTQQAIKDNRARANGLTTLINFYCVCTVGGLEHSASISEQQISAILPTILKGMSSNVADFAAASYIISVRMLLKCKLSVKLLDQLVLKLTNSKSPLLSEATLVLVFIYQSQSETYTTFPAKAINKLVGTEWFLTAIGKLCSSGAHVLPLIVPVLKGLLERIEVDSHKDYINNLLPQLRFDDEAMEQLILSVLDNSPDLKSLDQRSVEWCGQFVKSIERQYPSSFDKVVHLVMAGGGSEKQRQVLCSYLNIIMSLSFKQNNVFEKLYHPSAHLRENAVSFFVKNYPNLNEKERAIFKNAIVDRLLEDNKSVVRAVLNLKRKYLAQLLGAESFMDILIKLLKLCYKRLWYDISMTVITLLCNNKAGENTKIFLAILPLLLPTNNDELIVALHILKTEYSNSSSLLQCVKSKTPEEISAVSFCDSMYSALCDCKNLPDISDLMDMLENDTEEAMQRYLSVVLVTCGAPKRCHVTLGLKILNSMFSFVDAKMKVAIADDTSSPVSCRYLLTARNGVVPLQGVLLCLNIFIEKVINVEMCDGWFNFSCPDDALTFVMRLFVFLLNGCSGTKDSKFYSVTLSKFFNTYFPAFKDKIVLFANMLTIDSSDKFEIPLATQLRALQGLHLLLQSGRSISWTLKFHSSILVPSVLIGLLNPTLEIREVATQILSSIATCVHFDLNETFMPLVQELAKRKQALVLDNQQIALILFAVFDENKDKITHVLDTLFEISCNYKNPIHINAKLLKILTFVNSIKILELVSGLAIHLLEYVGNKEDIVDVHRSEVFYNCLLRINDTTSKDITLDSITFKFLSMALKHDTYLEYTKGKIACLSALALEQITREVFSSLKFEIQEAIIYLSSEVFTSTNKSQVVSAINKMVKRVELDVKLLVSGLENMRDVKSNKVDMKKRISLIPTVDILNMKEWIRGLTLLEFIQDKKKISNTQVLFPMLFEILKKCLDFDEQAAVEYPKQLLLSAILQSCEKLGKHIDNEFLNVEVVVQCLRASPNPQTHHHALLLLSQLATLVPDQLLHSVMAIFTFMGTSVLRHDDAYSFQIIAKVVDTIVPILTNSSANREKVCDVLRVFVDILLDVPEHRRLPLFTKLLTTLGVEQHLWIFLLLVIQSHVFRPADKLKVVPRLQAASEITQQFPPDVIMKSSIKLLEFVKKMSGEKGSSFDPDLAILNMKIYTPKQFRHYKYTLVTFVSGLLSSKELVNKVAVMNTKETEKIEELYKSIIINILTYIQTITKDSKRGSEQTQYWKVMLHHCYDILDSINALLTKEMFLLVVRGLVVHNISTVRRKALELLNTKLQHQPSFFTNASDEKVTENTEPDLLALLPSLINIIKTIESDEDPELELVQQTALLSLKLLIKLLASKNTDKFTPLLDFVCDLIKTDKVQVQNHMLASVVLCLGELVSNLRAHAISALPKYMPAIIKVLKVQKHQETPNLLLMCVVTTVHKIIETLPLFLSPYLEKVLFEISVLSCRWNVSIDNSHKITPFLSKLTGTRAGIGNKIPPRVLIPIISRTYQLLLKNKQYDAVGPLMNVLCENLSVCGQELNALLSELTTFFLFALEFRNDTDIDIQEINTVEDHVVQCLMVLVLKLSESTFRPLYYRLYDWAVRCEGKTERIITFYRLSAEIAEKLKGLFVLFAGHFIRNAAFVLDECNVSKSGKVYLDDEKKCALLLESVLRLLIPIFTYDGQSFVDKTRFEMLLQPLVDQLENTSLSNYADRCQHIVSRCVSKFAVSCGDDTLWKQLNYQVLLKTRHEDAAVRLQALHCIGQLSAAIGEDFLPLLPETIPFLAELLEDEDETVEKMTQNTVRELENILGEPLQKYF